MPWTDNLSVALRHDPSLVATIQGDSNAGGGGEPAHGGDVTASVTMTYDHYGHLMPGNEAEAASLADGYLERLTGA